MGEARMDVDTNMRKGQLVAGAAGAGTAQALEHLNHFTLADMASAAVLIFTVYQFHAMFYDRNIKPRGGYRAIFGLGKR